MDSQMEQMARASKAAPPPKIDSVMIDLETLGTQADAAILSIGAVKFVRNGDYIDDAAFYASIAFGSQPQRFISGDTLAWWMKQSDEARAAWSEPGKISLGSALGQMKEWLGKSDETLFYSNGADFDIPMIEHALRTYGYSPLGNFWNHRCYRTMKSEYPSVQVPREGAHNALMDAIYQAKHLQAIYRFKREGKLDVPKKGFSAR